jgi:putative effector of murein hydrolase LrgA (UPF0299 family)
MIGQMDTLRHPDVGRLLQMMAVLMTPAAVDNITLFPLMTADGIGIALVLFADQEV